MKFRTKSKIIGILYLLWQFTPAGVELVQAQYTVDERITATRKCTSNRPSCGGGGYRGRRGGGNFAGSFLGGLVGGVIGSAIGPAITQQQRPVIVQRPVSYPPPQQYPGQYPGQYPQYPRQPHPPTYPTYPGPGSYQQQEGAIFITGSGDAVELIRRSLINNGKLVALNKQYASVELKVTQKKVGNEVQVSVDVIDIMSQSYIDSQVGVGVLTANSPEAQRLAVQTAAQDVLSRLTI